LDELDELGEGEVLTWMIDNADISCNRNSANVRAYICAKPGIYLLYLSGARTTKLDHVGILQTPS